jgi:hypothetical protein
MRPDNSAEHRTSTIEAKVPTSHKSQVCFLLRVFFHTAPVLVASSHISCRNANPHDVSLFFTPSYFRKKLLIAVDRKPLQLHVSTGRSINCRRKD